MNPQKIKLTTRDGCTINLYYQKPHGDRHFPPVLLVHGFAANAAMWRPPTQEGHLASYLCHYGYPVYAIDLRFRKGKPSKQWNLDDYVLFDLPKAIQYIQKHSNSAKVHWIGHSMGGLLGYMYQALHGPENLLSLTVLGSPGFRGARKHSKTVLLGKSLIRVAKMGISTGRLDLIPNQVWSNVVNMHLLSIGAHWRSVHRLALEELRTKSILGNVSVHEAAQIATIIKRTGLTSSRFHFSYSDHSDKVRAPLFAIAADKDYIIPAALVRQGFLDAKSSKKHFLVMGEDHPHSYGHLDLIMSPFAKKDIWQHIRHWLESWNEPQIFPMPSYIKAIEAPCA